MILQAQKLAAAGRKAPVKLGARIEPTWAALIAQEGKVVASELFSPGDAQDAVARCWEKIKARAVPSELTLFLTLEPCAMFQRLAPVTESIRQTGIHRVVVGTIDPFLRYRGLGVAAMERMGISVVVCDGEEGRACQLLYEDYNKAMNRQLPLVFIQLSVHQKGEKFVAAAAGPGIASLRADAVLTDANTFLAAARNQIGDSWLLIDDSQALIAGDNTRLKESGARTVVCRPASAAEAASGLQEWGGAQRLSVPPTQQGIDLALSLRQARELGLMSVEIGGGAASLLVRSLKVGLVDRLRLHLDNEIVDNHTLSRIRQEGISFTDQQQADAFLIPINQPRIVDRGQKQVVLEASLEFVPTTNTGLVFA